jgi:adenylate cyclase
MADVFISYARSTAAQAQAVADGLRALGYDVWRDDELPAHRSYAEVIEERLQAAKAVVVIWSAEAVKSEWVQSEADTARTDRKLVQLNLDGSRLPRPFDRIQCADLAGWSGDMAAQGWKKVAASVADLVGGTGDTAEAPAAASRKLSICVLPFANMSGDPEQEYFSDGISEDIITDLSKVSALSVVARNTAFTFKGRSVEVPQVARQLGVSHVLEGSVRKAGNRVRITAQLIDGSAGDHIWAERYDRDLDDIFALQDEISETIVAELKLKLLPQEKQAIERRGTDSAEAYNLFLMARGYQETGTASDPARTTGPMERLCQRAVEIDPNYADAWALLGSARFSLFRLGAGAEDGRAELDRALALNPDLAEARTLKASMLDLSGQHEAAAAELAAALRLDPESYAANLRTGIFAYNEGRFHDAVPLLERAMLLDPTKREAPFMLVSAYRVLGDDENRRRAARAALTLAEAAIAKDPSNGTAMDVGVVALAALGELGRAKDWMDRAVLVDPDNFEMRYNFACTLACAGDTETALPMLALALEHDKGGYLIRTARTDPDFESLRDDPRFEAIVATAEARLAAAKAADAARAAESA